MAANLSGSTASGSQGGDTTGTAQPGKKGGESGAGGVQGDAGTESSLETNPTGATPGTGESGDTPAGAEPAKPKEKFLPQSKVNEIVARAKDEVKESLRAEILAELKEQQDADNGKWETVAKSRQTRIDTLTASNTTLTAQVAELLGAARVYVTAELLNVPATVRKLAPVDLPETDDELRATEFDATTAATLARWLPKAKETAATMQGGDERRGNPSGPQPKGTERGKPDSAAITKDTKRKTRFRL